MLSCRKWINFTTFSSNQKWITFSLNQKWIIHESEREKPYRNQTKNESFSSVPKQYFETPFCMHELEESWWLRRRGRRGSFYVLLHWNHGGWGEVEVVSCVLLVTSMMVGFRWTKMMVEEEWMMEEEGAWEAKCGFVIVKINDGRGERAWRRRRRRRRGVM